MIWIYLFLITLFIRPQDWPGSLVYGWPITDIIVLGGLISGLTKSAQLKNAFRMPQTYLIIVSAALAFVSNAANGNSDFGIEQATNFLKRFLIYIMLLLNMQSAKAVRDTLFFSLLTVIVLSFQGIYQDTYGVGWAQQALHTTSNQVDQSQMYRSAEFGTRIFWIGVWDGPNVLALVFLFVVPFCLEHIFMPKRTLISKLFYSALFALLGYSIYLTNSRGGFLAFAFMGMLFCFLRFSKKKLPFILLAMLPVLLLFAPARMSELDSSESSARDRKWLWEQGLNMFRANPAFGVGKGQYDKHAQLIAHNNYISYMAETGFAGLLLFVALVYLSLKSALAVYRDAHEHSELLGLSRTLLVVAGGFYFATSFVVMELEILYLLWALCAALFLLARKENIKLEMKLAFKDVALIGAASVAIIILVWLVAEKNII